jgi:glycosyltransferase involved in cell wall biosynthesis
MSTATPPIVSVVIPTRNRPELVVRAVQSALAQSLTDIEVIVVIDGPDAETALVLATLNDLRLHTVSLPESVGGSEARNIGARKSRGKFIALLDDDDEWYPDKLSRQLSVAKKSKLRFPVVTCRIVARRPAGDEIWPSRPMRMNESMSEYLLCREGSFRQGEGFIQASTLFVSRDLLLWVPFESGLPRHQDWDWIIRAAAYPGVKITWVWDTLVIHHMDAYRQLTGAGRTLEPSIDWISSNKHVTPKARAYFYATQIATRCRSFKVFCLVVRKTIRYPRAFLIAMGIALTPRPIAYLLRSRSVLKHA